MEEGYGEQRMKENGREGQKVEGRGRRERVEKGGMKGRGGRGVEKVE